MSDAGALESEIRGLIAGVGAISVERYMSLCLAHPQHGFYVTHDPFGAQGDFITAPDISQMFGELIGLWMAAVWRQMGEPDRVSVIELGPGRGTLMRDAMRAAHAVPAFAKAVSLHLVEISPRLRAKQKMALVDLPNPIDWHNSLSAVPEGEPCIIIGNEFIDALPIRQAVRHKGRWHERMITVGGDGRFAFTTSAEPIPHFEALLPAPLHDADDGAVFEWRSDTTALEIGRRVGRSGSAALLIDYGHIESDIGDTLQAAAGHAYADPLSAPGEADLTAHVDFAALARSVETMGADVHGAITQTEFLQRLGLFERADALRVRATEAQRIEIDSAVARLTGYGRTGMGELFKAIGLADPKLGSLPGLWT